MIIDSHQHVFWHHRNDADLIADMDRQKIDVAWLLTWEIPTIEDHPDNHAVLNPALFHPDGTHPGIVLSDVLMARDRYPKRFVVGYCPYPAHPAAPRLFEAAYHMHRVRVCGEWKYRLPFDDPRCVELFRKAGELKCPVVLHLDVPYLLRADSTQPQYDSRWYGGTIDNLERALRACPQTNFVGHAPGFWRSISGDADTARGNYPTGGIAPGGRLFPLFDANPNLYADISAGSGLRALKRDSAHARQFIQRYADRLLFGRDYYGGEHQEFLATLDLPRDVSEKLFFRNALKLVPLELPAESAMPLHRLAP